VSCTHFRGPGVTCRHRDLGCRRPQGAVPARTRRPRRMVDSGGTRDTAFACPGGVAGPRRLAPLAAPTYPGHGSHRDRPGLGVRDPVPEHAQLRHARQAPGLCGWRRRISLVRGPGGTHPDRSHLEAGRWVELGCTARNRSSAPRPSRRSSSRSSRGGKERPPSSTPGTAASAAQRSGTHRRGLRARRGSANEERVRRRRRRSTARAARESRGIAP
jgi:hypothetical protein